MATRFNFRLILPVVGAVFVTFGTIAVILFAKGFRPDLQDKTLTSSGILVANSSPDGAQLFVGGNLKTATNSTLNLDPGTYEIEIKKDGFFPWKKTLEVEAEIVTRATATLFPSVPSLRAITSSGASKPTLSSDGSKIAYLQTNESLSKLFVLDLNESTFGFINRDPRLIANFKFQISNLHWSPDSNQILTVASASASLIDVNNPRPTDVTNRLAILTDSWAAELRERERTKQATLPDKLKTILNTATKDIVWSPKETKILYTATASAVIPDNLITQLPGSSTQTQTRALSPGSVYVYDLEEDRNFQVDSTLVVSPSPTPKSRLSISQLITHNSQPNAGWVWFPDDGHLLRVEPTRIVVKEYDDHNSTVVYSGPMEPGFAAPYPSGQQLLILSNLNPETSSLPNLYAVSLR